MHSSNRFYRDQGFSHPSSLRGGAATKVVSAMIAKSFLEEVDASLFKGEPVWRQTGDGHGSTRVVTDAGFAAVGSEPETERRKGSGEDHAQTDPATKAKPRATYPGTKQAGLVELLRTPDGATLKQMAAATVWQVHTVPGAMRVR